jgi:hypothetical protein
MLYPLPDMVFLCQEAWFVWVHSPQQDCHWWFANGNITYTCVRTCNRLVLIKRLCSKLEFMHHWPCTGICNFTLNTNTLNNALLRTDLYLLCFSQLGHHQTENVWCFQRHLWYSIWATIYCRRLTLVSPANLKSSLNRTIHLLL